jgi:hypothetical protein
MIAAGSRGSHRRSTYDRRLPDHGPRQRRAGLDYVHDPEERIEAAKQRLLEWKAGDLVVRYAVSHEDIGKAEEDFRAGMSLYRLVLGAVLAALSSPGIRELPTSPGEHGSRIPAPRRGFLGSRFAVVRGDLWAEAAFTYANLEWPDSAQIHGKRMTRRRLEPREPLASSREIPLVWYSQIFSARTRDCDDGPHRPLARNVATYQQALFGVELQQAPCAVACSDFGQNVYN